MKYFLVPLLFILTVQCSAPGKKDYVVHHQKNNLIGKNLKRAGYNDKAEELRECLLEWLKKNNSRHYNVVKERELI